MNARQRRLYRTRWWREQMRHVVDKAIGWQNNDMNEPKPLTEASNVPSEQVGAPSESEAEDFVYSLRPEQRIFFHDVVSSKDTRIKELEQTISALNESRRIVDETQAEYRRRLEERLEAAEKERNDLCTRRAELLGENDKLQQQLKEAEILLAHKNETANTFMNQVRKLQEKDATAQQQIERLREALKKVSECKTHNDFSLEMYSCSCAMIVEGVLNETAPKEDEK